MLRELKSRDVEAIYEINKESLGYDFSPEKTANQMAKLSQDVHHFLLGYEDSSSHELLGYVHAEVYESLYSQPGFNILALAVQPDHQGQGIGKSLLEGLEKEAKRRGYGFIRLNSADHRRGLTHFTKQLAILAIKCRNGSYASFSLSLLSFKNLDVRHN